MSATMSLTSDSIPIYQDTLLSFTENWDLDGFTTDNLTAPVELIHLCALRNELNEGDEAGEPPTNHWTTCLQITESSSVMLDMAPGYGSDGLRGKIAVTSLGEPYTDETLKAFSFKPVKATTVGDVFALIMDKGRARFNFSPEWEGCRFWMGVVIEDLENAGIVQAGSAAMAKEALLKYWINPEGSEFRVLREGTFRKG